MNGATVYVQPSRSNHPVKEMLIYDGVEAALASLVAVERRLLTNDCEEAREARRSRPGLGHITPHDSIIALGKSAHTVLADFQKRTLLANDLDLDEQDDGDVEALQEDMSRLIWSCINTLKVIAVGKGAWRSIQMLPLFDRRFYEVPPLRIAPPFDTSCRDTVLVVNHDQDDERARSVASRFREKGMNVELSGFSREVSDKPASKQRAFCTGEAAIHVHVGHHTLAEEKLRIIDSWYSRRLVLQLLPPRPYQIEAAAKNLIIDDEVNGFVCNDPGSIVAVCAEVRQDRVLERKVIDNGYRAVEPLAQAWTAIARDLLG